MHLGTLWKGILLLACELSVLHIPKKSQKSLKEIFQ